MTGTTPVYGIPYPESTDPPNGPSQMQALALEVEAELARIDARANTAPVVRKYTAGATWTKPAASTGFLGVWARVTGGGGGSGSVAAVSASLSPSAGGGGGGTAEVWIPASALGATETVTVGAAGTAGTGGGSGGAGGTSSFGAHVTAGGGGGGSNAGAGTSAAYSASGGSGSSVFGGTATPRLEYQGANGMNGFRLSASVGFSGNGGMAGLVGVAAIGRSTTGAGSAGQVPGGGAAGAINEGTSIAANGSAGARGEVIVTELYGA